MKPLEEPIESTYSRKWLVVPAALGSALVLSNLVWTNRHGTDDHNAIPGVLSDIGVTLVLFSVLFWFERRIERRILRSIQVLSQGDLAEKYGEGSADPLVFGDFHAEQGPMTTALAVMEAVGAGDYDTVWNLSDPNLRLCRAQAWIFNNVDTLGIAAEPDDEWGALVDYLFNGPHPDEPLWRGFAATEIRQLSEAYDGYESGKWGWSNRRRIVGPRHEVLVLTPLPKNAPHGFVANGPTLLDGSHSIVMRCIAEDEGAANGRFYLYAGEGYSVPLPGWPPTFWIDGDPIALANHPGANDDA